MSDDHNGNSNLKIPRELYRRYCSVSCRHLMYQQTWIIPRRNGIRVTGFDFIGDARQVLPVESTLDVDPPHLVVSLQSYTISTTAISHVSALLTSRSAVV
jgi:hypothetical protein